MEESPESKQLLEALSRWRESCIFYFKFDLALIAAVAAMVSFFKLQGSELIRAASQYKFALNYLIAMLVYALLFELCITNISNRKDLVAVLSDERKRAWMYRGIKWGYELQVLAHVFLLMFAFGYASGFVEGSMACHAGNAGCGT